MNKKKSQAISKNIKVFNQAADCKFEYNNKIKATAAPHGAGYQPLRAAKHNVSTSYSSVNFANTASTFK